MKKKYEMKFANSLKVDEETWYVYNVYKRFLFFFQRPVFSSEGKIPSKCRDECRKYILEHE